MFSEGCKQGQQPGARKLLIKAGGVIGRKEGKQQLWADFKNDNTKASRTSLSSFSKIEMREVSSSVGQETPLSNASREQETHFSTEASQEA